MRIIDLTIETFDSKMNKNKMVVLVFWAPWCAPCKPLLPIIDAAAATHPDVLFAKIDIEDQPELAKSLQVRSIPTLVFIREKIVIFANAGLISADELTQQLKKLTVLDMKKVRQDYAKAQKVNSS